MNKVIGKSYYECHVTIKLPTENTGETSPVGEQLDRIKYVHDLEWAVQKLGWKFSVIRDDIALGSGDKAYATTHLNAKLPRDQVIRKLSHAANTLADLGYDVIRKKVEEVIYDDRSTAIQPGTCEGACVECHLDDYAERQYEDRKYIVSNIPPPQSTAEFASMLKMSQQVQTYDDWSEAKPTLPDDTLIVKQAVGSPNEVNFMVRIGHPDIKVSIEQRPTGYLLTATMTETRMP